MARLHYHRWQEKFVRDNFSSEASMRDYLFSNPGLIFEEDNAWVIPIKEEHFLREIEDKERGRADIILCRITNTDENRVKEEKKLSLSYVELWVVELKKEEASYDNGFKQLSNYIKWLGNNLELKREIMLKLKRSLEAELREKIEFEPDTPIDVYGNLAVYGSLVAPSFDLISERKDIPETLKGKRQQITGQGFTLSDHVLAFPNFSLIKIIRFKRGDEEIVFSENILGTKAAGLVARVDPLELFNKGLIAEKDTFYFRDDKGSNHKEAECKVLKKRGVSHSFVIRIQRVGAYDYIDMPKWAKDHYDYETDHFPAKENTAKMCSIALHKLFKLYNDDELFKGYWNFGEKHFARTTDDKTLSQLREEQRPHVW